MKRRNLEELYDDEVFYLHEMVSHLDMATPEEDEDVLDTLKDISRSVGKIRKIIREYSEDK